MNTRECIIKYGLESSEDNKKSNENQIRENHKIPKKKNLECNNNLRRIAMTREKKIYRGFVIAMELASTRTY